MIRALALVLTFLTGFSGLVYEVAWQKYLATLLGAQSEATAAVLGLYLGGLALGYAVFGRVTDRVVARADARGEAPRLFFVYGLVEAAIGVYAQLFPWVFTGAQKVSFLAPTGHPALSFSFDVVLTALMLVPPTVLMGGTIPILTQALARSLDDATRIHAWIYAFNTAGAFLGSLAGGFFLLPWLGLDGALRVIGVVNLVAGVSFLAMQPRTRGGSAPAPAAPTPVFARFAGFAAVALLAGFAMMVLQTVLNRVGGLAFGASHYTFAMVVAVFVLCIAIGSSLVSSLTRISPWLVVASQWLLVGLLALLYLELQNATYYAHVVRVLFRDLPEGFYPYQLAIFVSLLAVLCVPIGISGALLPLLFHHLRRELGDLGGIAGKLYSWNTLGSLCGALLGGYVLLFWVDLQEVYQVALAALVVGAALLTTLVARVPARVSAAVAVVALAGVFLLPDWDESRLSIGRFRIRAPEPGAFAGADAYFANRVPGLRMIFYDDDPVNTVAIYEAPTESGKTTLSIYNNGKSDGQIIGDYPTMCLLAALPALVTDDPSSSFVVGWGTGVSAGELGSLAGTKSVTVAEISQGVIAAAPLFDASAQQASKNPTVKVLRSDAYRALLRSDERYGMIISEPSNPWVTGVEMLYSEDFLRAARSRLTPGGVYAQWFHLYELDFATVEIVAQTYASVFDTVAVWFSTGPDLILLGFNDDAGYPDVATLRQRFEEPTLNASFRRCSTKTFAQLAAHEVLPPGVLNAANFTGEVHTLRHPVLSHHAARAFFAGETVPFPRVPLPSNGKKPHPPLFARAFDVASFGEEQYEEVATHVCELNGQAECATWVARWMDAFPQSEKRRALVARLTANGAWSEALNEHMQESLAALYRGELPPALKGNPLQAAETVTNLYARLFVHAIPFPRKSLDRAWNDCGSSGLAIECQERRRVIRPRLDSFALAQAD
jgi:predicted membrane-bound spermidine synthase